jgi:hypothetical protein
MSKIDQEHEATIRRETAREIAAAMEARARDFEAHNRATSAAVLLGQADRIRRHYGVSEEVSHAKA